MYLSNPGRRAATRAMGLAYRRNASTTSVPPEAIIASDEALIYRAPMNNAVKVLKFFSVSSLGLSALGLPLSLLVDPAIAEANAAAAFMLSPTTMTAVTAFSSMTTLAAHKFLGPYVTRVFLHGNASSAAPVSVDATAAGALPVVTADSIVTIETLTLFNSPRYTTARLGEVLYSKQTTIAWELGPQPTLTLVGEKQLPVPRQFMLLLRRGLTPEMRACVQFVAGKYRLLTMYDWTASKQESKATSSPPPLPSGPSRTATTHGKAQPGGVLVSKGYPTSTSSRS
ncbi:hypothetical protein BC828DRAFT_386312 [Blastocladiella britannica]|nr:hypothetical protein BC828DRAFT_386312 [Blastocladiella britannica]